MLAFARQQIGKPFSGTGMARSLIWPRTPTGENWWAGSSHTTPDGAGSSQRRVPAAQVLCRARGGVPAVRRPAQPRVQPGRRDAAQPLPAVQGAGCGRGQPLHASEPVFGAPREGAVGAAHAARAAHGASVEQRGVRAQASPARSGDPSGRPLEDAARQRSPAASGLARRARRGVAAVASGHDADAILEQSQHAAAAVARVRAHLRTQLSAPRSREHIRVRLCAVR